MRKYIETVNLFVLAVFAYLTTVSIFVFIVTVSEDRYFRQRRIINAVEEYSRMVSFDSIHESKEFIQFTETLRAMGQAPYIIFFDSSNVDVTLNHICNLEFIPNSLPRLAAVAFDTKSHIELANKYPQIPNVLVDMEPIKDAMREDLENRRYILYQLILLTRARICASLAARDLNFWAMQQDSVWIENFGAMELENRYNDANMLFDTIGNDLVPEYKRMHGWICGSTFYVKGNPTTYNFFRKVDIMMRSRQSPDSAIMSYLCGYRHYKCQRLPRWIISSSNYFRGPRDTVPVMIQVDSDQKTMSKMELFKKSNFIFRLENGTCDRDSVIRLRDSVRKAMPELFKNDLVYEESIYQRIHYSIRQILNIDRYNNKYFLTVHETLV